MNLRNMSLGLLILNGLCGNASADEIICHGLKRGFGIATPAHWEVDSAKGKTLGVCAVFYPARSTFDNAPTVIYPRHFEDKTGKADLAAFIRDDLKEFTDASPAAKIVDLPLSKALLQAGFLGKTLLNGPPPNNFEDILYLAKEESIFILVSSAKKEEALRSARPVFLLTAQSTREVKIHSTIKGR